MRILVAVLLAAGLLTAARAQEDTTPPVLVDFTISPVAFDTGTGDVTLNWCITAWDDLSGDNTLPRWARW